jgi:hypothetical protein
MRNTGVGGKPESALERRKSVIQRGIVIQGELLYIGNEKGGCYT